MKTKLIFTALAAALIIGVGAGLPAPASADRGGGHGYYGRGGGGHGHYSRSGGGHGYYSRGYYRGFGVYIGSPYPYYRYPYWGSPYPYYAYPYPYWGSPSPYYPPAIVAVPSSPPVYIEKGDSAAPAQNDAPAYWYYCAGSNAYYPYVKQCPGGWERQVPLPPPDAR